MRRMLAMLCAFGSVALMGAGPLSTPDWMEAHRPRGGLAEAGSVVFDGWDYVNSFEVTPTTNCAGDEGTPAATRSIGGTPDCDHAGAGVTDGSEALSLGAASGDSLRLDGIFPADTPKTFRFDIHRTANVASTEQMVSLWAGGFPAATVYAMAGGDLGLGCLALDSTLVGALPANTTRTLDFIAVNATTVRLRVWSGSTLLHDVTCASGGFEKWDTGGIIFLETAVGDVIVDNILAATGPVPPAP